MAKKRDDLEGRSSKQYFGLDKVTNWERVQAKGRFSKAGLRNVYEEQQLERSTLDKPLSPGPRLVFTGVLCVLIFIFAWLAVAAIEWVFMEVGGSVASGSLSAFGGNYDFMSDVVFNFDIFKLFIALLTTGVIGSVVGFRLLRILRSQNAMSDTTDINQHMDDQHVALPEEIQRQFDWFPDVGAHSSVQVSSLISHMMLSNKGIKRVPLTQFHQKDEVDEENNEWLKGEPVEDGEGRLIQKSKPMFDKDFAKALYDASGATPEDHKFYDTTKIPYNPGSKNRDKLKGYDTVADVINGDWELPDYEPQRPAGAYLVDTAPVNTMVLAMTRAGKGQTIIEPTIDMWLREKRPNNIVVNDPKGELLIKNYVPAVKRGYQVVQFNLINALKTDIYNPLALAADAAREGDFTQCSTYIENIANVFFPLDGSEDPVWPNAANNAFKRAAYGLIDYYLEEEREFRAKAEREKMDPKVVETHVDELWGHVTLYNCYQLFVQLSARKGNNPTTQKAPDADKPFNQFTPNALVEYGKTHPDYQDEVNRQVILSDVVWEANPQADLLTLFFNATEHLPRNQMRTLVADTNNALRAMGGAEKMMASVYAIAITAMSFFTDPTISTLTSGTLSQNVDLPGLSFPRRFGVRFQPEFIERNNLIGMAAVWDGFADSQFTKCLGKDFHHEDSVRREGWAKCFIDGKFPKDKGYLRLRLQNPMTGQRIHTFYFEFQKGYQTSLDGRKFIKDAVTGERQVRNGVLREMVRGKDGKIRYGRVRFTVKRARYSEDDDYAKPKMVTTKEPVISQLQVRYGEKPKIIFLVTPPHLMKYAKIILILLKQLVDLNFAQSYMTKDSQKPLYKTRYMLDELGNLQSDGHGISGFSTMLSIGLGQDQQFTIILQTLQQLIAVYSEHEDKILQGNAQPLSAKLATPEGYIRMGDVKVGDTLLTPRGETTKVLGVFPRGKRKVYRVTRRDGSSTLACGEHLWRVKVKKGGDERGEAS